MKPSNLLAFSALVSISSPAIGQIQWTQRAVTGPSPRSSYAMAYDSARGVTCLVGGAIAGVYNGETWEWNGAAWTQRMVTGPSPSPRGGSAMTYDAARGACVLFGGFDTDWIGDTWEWNGSMWTQRCISCAPPPRSHHAMAYDTARGVTVLFGGWNGTVYHGDTWEWDGSAWTWKANSGPSPRTISKMAYDVHRGVTVLFGGGLNDTFEGDTWEWNGTAWTQRMVSGPSPRRAHAIAYDADRAVTVLFGGMTVNGVNGETWEWNGSTWFQRPISGPSPRRAHGMVYDTARGVSVLFGGYNDLDDASAFNGETWELGPSTDCNTNGTPDTSELPGHDCNSNRTLDACEGGCNTNGTPDDCDVSAMLGFSPAPSLNLDPSFVNWMTARATTVAGPQVPLDLNKDGHTDLVVTSQSAPSVLSVFRGRGDGRFWPRDIYQLSGGLPQNPAVANFNNDGYVDVAVANRGGGSLPADYLSLFLNAGNGTFLPEVQIPLGQFTSQFVVAADFDHDGRIDLISVPFFQPSPGFTLQALRNSSNGMFAAPIVYDAGTNGFPGFAKRATVGDFDNDGWPDLAISIEEGAVFVFLNSHQGFGGSLFGPPTAHNGGDAPLAISAADIDSDGHVDIVVSDFGEHGMPAMGILWNNGDGTFPPAAQLYPGGPNPYAHTVADLDNDGDLDIAVGELPLPFVLENRGGRVFAPASGFASDGIISVIASGDFNEDGCADLANGAYNRIDILLNRCGPLSRDCNTNGTPDECEPDCNTNGVQDACDIAGLPQQVAKLIATDAAANDWFGQSVSVSGDTAIVGAWLKDDACTANTNCDSGAAYVFVRSGGVWTLQQKLTASDASAGDAFGVSVAIDGDTAVVGANLDDHSGGYDAGAAYVFVRDPMGNWTEQAKLTASDAAPYNWFGFSVSVSTNTAVVGAYRDDRAGGVDAGSAYVFVRDPMGNWTQHQKLTASDAGPGDQFGQFVSVSADTVVVGAVLHDSPGMDSGSAYVFVQPAGGWSSVPTPMHETARLAASDGAAGDQFGVVSVSGDTVLVGAPFDDTCPANPDCGSGSAYVFVKPVGVGGWSTAPSPMNETAKLTASDAAPGDEFGVSVSVAGNVAVVGAFQPTYSGASGPGHAYVFVRRSDGMWTQQQKLTASDAAPNDRFGASVSVSGETAVVGAYLDDHAGGTNAGSAYGFDLNITGRAADCNTNGTPDECELARRDCNSNLTLDVCETLLPDCNTNGVLDVCEPDCNTNATADACEGDLRPCILVQPQDIIICSGNEGPIDVVAGCVGPFRYEWHRVDASGDHPLPNWTGPSIFVGEAGCYYCIVSNDCGSVTSRCATLTPVPPGTGDGNGDGRIDGDDIQRMIDVLLGGAPPTLADHAYDMDCDNDVTSADVPLFVAALLH